MPGDKGRATNNAAKAILGLVYLTRTGPTYGIDGPGLATSDFALAGGMFDAVIASGKFSFVASYPSIFSYTNEGNPDIVFDIQAINAGGSGDVGTGARFVTEIYDGLYGNKPVTTCNPTCGTIGFAGGADSDSPKAPSVDSNKIISESGIKAIDPKLSFKNKPVSVPETCDKASAHNMML